MVGRVVIHALAIVRPYRAHPVAAERVVLDELEILLSSDQWSRIARECHYREGSEDGVDGAPLETELAQVGPVQERSGGVEKLPGRWMAATCGSWLDLLRRSRLRGGLRLSFHIEPKLLRVRLPRHSLNVADMSLRRGEHQTRTMRA